MKLDRWHHEISTRLGVETLWDGVLEICGDKAIVQMTISSEQLAKLRRARKWKAVIEVKDSHWEERTP